MPSMRRRRPRTPTPIRTIERFLAQIDSAARDTGEGVGLGEEIFLHGDVTGIGLTYEERLIHLAALSVPE